MEEIEYLGERIYRWKTGASTYLAWPERGARLMNWSIDYADGTFREMIRWPSINTADEMVKARGGNPILFPFSARTFHKGEIKQWHAPDGEIRPMPMHGLTRQGKFETTRVDKTGFSARFVPTPNDFEAYPFQYDFEVIYRFEEKQFSVEFRLENRDKVTIPWSAGHHFYFAIPWVDGTTRADYAIKIPAKATARQTDDGSLAPITPVKTETTIADSELVDKVHYQLDSSLVECHCTKDDSKLEIEIGTNAKPSQDFAIVTWTEAEDSPFFCIEPWMGPPNSPENKIGLHSVPPGEVGKFSVTVRI